MTRPLLTLFKLAWALPNTALGAVVLAMILPFGVRIRHVDGVIEVHGAGSAWLLRHLVPLKGGATAITLGHIILGRSRTGLERFRAHEHAHVRQCERWGPLFIPAYLIAGVAAIVQGGHAYRDNVFERQARAEEAEYPARRSASMGRVTRIRPED